MKQNSTAIQNSKRIIRYLVFILFYGCLFTPAIKAQKGGTTQKISISGKVTDSKNVPLDGVSVFVKGTKKGIVSDAQGLFTVRNVPENGTLVFSMIGFAKKEVDSKNGEFLAISLSEEVASLSDVVVTGYGTAKKKDLTGSVIQVKASRFENENPRSVQDLLRGNAPGLDVGFDPSTKGQSGGL